MNDDVTGREKYAKLKRRERNTPAVTIRPAKNENDGQFGRNNKKSTADSFLEGKKKKKKKINFF